MMEDETDTFPDGDEYELVQAFDIDDGELDGLSPQQCFVLGVEYESCRQLIIAGKLFTKTIHSANAERLSRISAALTYQAKWLNDDWIQISRIAQEPKDADQ